MKPWFAIDADGWEDILSCLPRPLTTAQARADLRYLENECRMGRKFPGRPKLASRWGWKPNQVRKLLKANDWHDPTRPHSCRNIKPPAKNQEGTSDSPAIHQESAPKSPKTQEQVTSDSPAKNQEGTRKTPHARSKPLNQEPLNQSSSSLDAREDLKALVSVRAELHREVLSFPPGETFEATQLPELTERISREIRTHHAALNLIEALTALGRWAYLSPDAHWAHSAGEPLKAILGGETSTRMHRVGEAMIWRAAKEPTRKGWQKARGNSRRGQAGRRQSFTSMVPKDAGSDTEIPFGEWNPAQDGQ